MNDFGIILSHLVFLILIEESVPDVDEEDLENSACSAFPHMYWNKEN